MKIFSTAGSFHCGIIAGKDCLVGDLEREKFLCRGEQRRRRPSLNHRTKAHKFTEHLLAKAEVKNDVLPPGQLVCTRDDSLACSYMTCSYIVDEARPGRAVSSRTRTRTCRTEHLRQLLLILVVLVVVLLVQYGRLLCLASTTLDGSTRGSSVSGGVSAHRIS